MTAFSLVIVSLVDDAARTALRLSYWVMFLHGIVFFLLGCYLRPRVPLPHLFDATQDDDDKKQMEFTLSYLEDDDTAPSANSGSSSQKQLVEHDYCSCAGLLPLLWAMLWLLSLFIIGVIAVMGRFNQTDRDAVFEGSSSSVNVSELLLQIAIHLLPMIMVWLVLGLPGKPVHFLHTTLAALLLVLAYNIVLLIASTDAAAVYELGPKMGDPGVRDGATVAILVAFVVASAVAELTVSDVWDWM
jgi:hypothetical protein